MPAGQIESVFVRRASPGFAGAPNAPPGPLQSGAGALSESMGSADRPRSIVVIEDDPDILEGLEELLGDVGYRVLPYRRADQALRDFEAGLHPDLIVLDLMMPGMNGWQFRVEQKQRPAISDIPVVALSADASPYAAAIDADAYLRKPVAFDKLHAVVEQVLVATERKRLAAQAIELERLRSLGMLVATVAHEINNPLTYVLGSLEMARKQCQKIREDPLRSQEAAPRIADHVEAAVDGSERIASIVQLLSTFVRGGDHELKPIDPLRPLRAAIRLSAHQIQGRARLSCELEPVPRVKASEARLSQVFLNLLVNAAQAIPPESPDVQEVRVRASVTPDARVLIEVEDTGVGIAPEVAERIFEPFYTTKPPGTGTGIGLSICRDIVSSVGGVISVRSEPGRGATFRVELPVAAPPAAPTPDPDGSAGTANGAAKRILVLDDEPLIGQVVVAALERHHVDVAVEPADALRLAAAGHYDLVLCDLSMPVMTGIEFFEELTRVRPDLARAFVLMTGAVGEDSLVRFAAEHSVRILKKPFGISELAAYVSDGSAQPVRPQVTLA